MRPIEHGTDRGYQAERRRGLVTCAACVEGHRLYQQEVRARRVPSVRELVPCGSPSAYRRHLRRGEIACAECLAAHVDEVSSYKRPRRAAS